MREGTVVLGCGRERQGTPSQVLAALETKWMCEILLFVTWSGVVPPERLGVSNPAWSPEIILCFLQLPHGGTCLEGGCSGCVIVVVAGSRSGTQPLLLVLEGVSSKQGAPRVRLKCPKEQGLRPHYPGEQRTLGGGGEEKDLCVYIYTLIFLTRYRNKICWHLFFSPKAVVAARCVWNSSGQLGGVVLPKTKPNKPPPEQRRCRLLQNASLRTVSVLASTARFLAPCFSPGPVQGWYSLFGGLREAVGVSTAGAWAPAQPDPDTTPEFQAQRGPGGSCRVHSLKVGCFHVFAPSGV